MTAKNPFLLGLMVFLLSACGGSSEEAAQQESVPTPEGQESPTPSTNTINLTGVTGETITTKVLVSGAVSTNRGVVGSNVANSQATITLSQINEVIQGNITFLLGVSDPDGINAVNLVLPSVNKSLPICTQECGTNFEQSVIGLSPYFYGIDAGDLRLEIWITDSLNNQVLADAITVSWQPYKIEGTTAQRDEQSINLSWQANENLNRYNIYLATEAGVTTTNINDLENGQQFLGLSGTTFSISDTLTDKSYQILLTGIDGSGESGFAEVINIAPLGGTLNFAPKAFNDQFEVNEDQALLNNVLTNDTDEYQGDLTVNTTALVSPQHGSVVINSSGEFTYTPRANFNGIDAFSYLVINELGMTDTGIVEITINAVNDVPSALDNTYNINADGTLFVTAPGLLANDSDIDLDTLTVDTTPVTSPLKGNLTLNTDGSFEYTGSANMQGTDSFQYRIFDAQGAQAVADVTINPLDQNSPPSASNDSYSVNEDNTLVVDAALGLLANDTDPNNDTFIIDDTYLVSPAHGQLFLATDGSFSYIPDPNYYGIDEFQYQVIDTLGATATATATLTINSTPDNPIAQNDEYQFQYNQTLSITAKNGLLKNDVNIEYGGLTINTTPVVNVQSGTLTLSNDGSFTYEPNLDALDVDSFTYSVTNEQGLAATAQVILSKTGSNSPAKANDDQYTLTEDSPSTILNVLENDTDANGDTITLINITNTVGTAQIVNNSIEYTPEPNYFGEVTLSYTISDGIADDAPQSSTATVILTIIPINDAPIATSDSASMIEDASPILIDVLANDSDVDDDNLTITRVVTELGMASIVENKIEYTPTPNSNGVAIVSYTISDGNGASASANLQITISPTNDAPVANPDSITIAEDAQGTLINVLSNDTDIDGDSLNISSVVSDIGNAAILNNLIQYTPSADENGTATITYSLTDGIASTTGTLIVTITPVNDAPIANPDAATISEDATTTNINVLSNDTDIDNDTLSISSASTTSGSVAVAGSNLAYTPDANFSGQAIVNYTITDGAESAAGILTITVTPVNDAPVANPDTATILEDASTTNINVLSNDTNKDNDALSISAATANTGSVAVVGNNIAYTPDANYNGQVIVNYTITDGTESAAGILTITVTPVNDLPVANPDTATIIEDSVTTNVNVLSNDTDEDNDSLSISTAAANTGSVSVAGSNLAYTPEANFNGQAIINYTITDGTESAAGILTIIVTPVNDAPIAINQTFSIGENAIDDATIGTIAASDIENNTLSFSLSGGETGLFNINSTSGLLSVNGTRPFNYETATQHSVNIDITDDGSPNETTTITVTVNVTDDVVPLIPVEDDTFGRPLSGQVDLSRVFSDGEFNDSIELNTNLYFVGYNNNEDADIIVTSYTNTGDVNTAFNGTGFKTIDLGEDEKGTAIISGNGELFIGYTSFNGTETEACLLKMSATGIVSTNSGDGNSGTKCTTLASESVIHDLEFTDNKVQGVGYSVNGLDKDSLFLKYDVSTLAFEAGSPGIVDVSGNNDDDESHAIKNFGNSDLLVVGSTIGEEGDLDATVRYLIPDGNSRGSFNSGNALIIDLSDEEGDDELVAIGGIDAVNFTAYLGGYITRSSGEKEAVLISFNRSGDIDDDDIDEEMTIYNIDGNSGTGNGGAQITGVKYAPMSNQLILSGTTGIEASDTTQNEQLFTARVSVSNGELDTSYGVSGINIISNVISNQSANAMTIDENDSVWLSGKFNDSTNEPFITSVTSNASLFTNFSTNGYTSLNNLTVSSDDLSMNMLQLKNGAQANKYLSASVAQFNTTNKLVLTRYTSVGIIDTSFSIDGIKALNINLAFKAVTLKELSDGSIIIAGTQINGLTEEGFIAKVGQDGYLDDSFATEGIYTTVDILNTDINFVDVAIDSGGYIVAVGTSTNASSVTRSFATMLKSNGTLENSFGTNGAYYGNIDEFFETLYIDINKEIFIAGKQVSGSDSQLIMLKIDDDANEIFTYTDTHITADITDSTTKVLADSAGNLYLIANEGTTPNQAVIIKLTPEGNKDSSFAASGVGQYQLASSFDTKVTDAALDTSGNIVLSGMSESKGMIARILADGTLDTLFGPNALGYYQAEQCDSTHQFTSMLLQTDAQVVLSSTCFDGTSNNVSVSKFDFYADGVKP
ncbi:Ig-like domain-containing protein [Pseudoalteromonas carrageenovora]|uniref:beta strand repeat-containing protein n=1 Tax=Pseudoalteromonas carrageenovora TaxID=227 RepID=UPI002FD47257